MKLSKKIGLIWLKLPLKKISNRLQKIDSMISSNYESIWDCCCDHGLLGLTLLKRKAASTIHFVDIVPSLTDHLESRLQKYFSAEDFAQRWQVHCSDVMKIPLTAQYKQMIIIAGVGGELLIKFFESLIEKFHEMSLIKPTIEIEFILCPVHYNYQVRQSLINHNCTLVNEYIVSENKRFYEVIHVKKQFSVLSSFPDPLESISPIGNTMWDLSIKLHQQYLTETISHYQRMLLSGKADEQRTVNHIIEQYSALIPSTINE
jgi:tRNA (adenine22-N1)-methyltransferase